MGIKILKGNETVTDGMIVTDSDHTAIHKGQASGFAQYFTLGNGETKSFSITAPLLNYIHFKNLELQVLGASIKVEILEEATITDDTGALIAINNPNRVSTVIPEAIVRIDPIYTGGEIVGITYVLVDSTNQASGNSSFISNPNKEIVFKNNNEKYIVAVTNLTTDSTKVFIKTFWYEEPEAVM